MAERQMPKVLLLVNPVHGTEVDFVIELPAERFQAVPYVDRLAYAIRCDWVAMNDLVQQIHLAVEERAKLGA